MTLSRAAAAQTIGAGRWEVLPYNVARGFNLKLNFNSTLLYFLYSDILPPQKSQTNDYRAALKHFQHDQAKTFFFLIEQ